MWEFFGALVAAIAAVTGSVVSNVSNRKSVEETNETNKALTAQANAAQAAESEKAYNRSKATNQVALLRQAGMSPAAAVGSLREGGSYTPAPINVAQVQSSQIDNPLASLSDLSSNLFSAGANSKQIKSQREQFEQQMKFQREQEETRKYEWQKQYDLQQTELFDKLKTNDVMREYTAAQKKLVEKQTDLTAGELESLTYKNALTLAQVQTEFAKYDLTLKQGAQVVEQTKLTAQEILNAKEQNKYIRENTQLVHEQFLSEMWKKDINQATANEIWSRVEKLNAEIERMLSPEGVQMWKDSAAVSHLQRQMTEIARDMKFTEKEMQDLDLILKGNQVKISNNELRKSTLDLGYQDNPIGFTLGAWNYMVSNAVPIKGLLVNNGK